MDEQQASVKSGNSSDRVDLDSVLTRALLCLDGMEGDYAEERTEIESIQQRLLAGKFRLAVLGQFKRGKSTFLNALLGEELLPTDILPATAIPTYINAAEDITIQVVFNSATEPVNFVPSSGQTVGDFLTEFVTEKGNPENYRNVAQVDIGHSADILKQGIVLIDTPGIGSTHKHNTDVAYQVLPQCDAAIFLVSVDPPITAIELDYLKEIKQYLPRTFFLLNKIDYLDDKEKDASLTFLANQLAPLCDGAPLVLPISARLGLTARLAGDFKGWQTSGMEQVERNLIDFFAREKQQILQASLQRRTSDQLNNINMQQQLSLKALMLPEEELKQRITQFRQSLPDVEREKQAASDVLSGDLKRVVARLNQEVEAVRSQAKQKIISQLDQLIQSVADTEELERLVREMLAQELPIFFSPAMRKVAEVIQVEATELLALHQQRSQRIVEQVRRIAAELFDIPYHAPSVSRSYTKFEISGWSHDLFISDMDPLGQKLSRKFLTQKYRRKRTVKRLREEGLKLLNQNVEQINWALRRGLDENFCQFGVELSEQLGRTITATRKAMEVALQKSESSAHETASREIKLKQAQAEIQKLRGELGE
ncbi:Dynamin family protein [Desulfuromusa kysingii]|uniref:Dynamin family protein n=1 Tax=Desulfuromusa kysingii TaxID=37625 RepID=A0A1H4C1R9_9BACT|nr:dynamin family protein [Desulfuromusa kysingii]SEA54032.1 Dynamin family protein [Desulfuromusa kysingii]